MTLPHRNFPRAKIVDGLITCRPDMKGALTRGARRPGTDSPFAHWVIPTPTRLLGELLGSDLSVGELAGSSAIGAARGNRFRRGDGGAECAAAGCWGRSSAAGYGL